MSNEVIAVDLDDVLGDNLGTVREFINTEFDLNHSAKHYDIIAPYWSYWETVWGVDDKEGRRMFDSYIKNGGHLKQKTLPQATRVIAKLEQQYRLIIVTARKLEHADETHQWLNQHFPSVFHDVKFVPVWGSDSSANKARICQEIGAGYLIDDNLEHCLAAHDAGVTALLFGNYGWNRNDNLSEGITRVKDWQAVAEYFGV